MYIFAYSYKTDSLHETIGTVTAPTYDEAVVLISQIKRLSTENVLSLFNIKRVEQ
jgi:hypothetical protein